MIQSALSPVQGGEQRAREEINFDDFFDSTPEKDEPTIEILQKKLIVKPKKKSVRRVFHDVSTAKELSARRTKESNTRRQPYHQRRSNTHCTEKDAYKSLMGLNSAQSLVAEDFSLIHTEEKHIPQLSFRQAVAQRKAMQYMR